MYRGEFENRIPKLKYGLGVINLNDIDDNMDVDILHAVLYLEKPDDNDKQLLYQELTEDDSFGFADMAEDLYIIDLPEDMVKRIIEDANNGDIEMEEHNETH